MDVLLTDMKKINARHALDLTGGRKENKERTQRNVYSFLFLSVSFAPLR
jgi:hypothetical protein